MFRNEDEKQDSPKDVPLTSEQLSLLEPLLKGDMRSFMNSDKRAIASTMLAVIQIMGPSHETFVQVRKILNEPLVKRYLARLAELLNPPLAAIVASHWGSREKQAQALYKLVHLTVANNISADNSVVEFEDSYVKEALLQRAAHMFNLEVIYLNNVSALTELYIKNIAGYFGQLLQALLFKLLENPSYLSKYFKRYFSMFDFLPDNKFAVLFIHPSELWVSENYEKFKNDTNLDIIKAEFIKVYAELSIDHPDLIIILSDFTLKIRQELIAVYDLLAENDRQLIQYCKDKKYKKDTLFNINKKVLLDLLKGLQENIDAVDETQRVAVNQIITSHIDSAANKQTWTEYSSEIQQQSLQLVSATTTNPLTYLDGLTAMYEKLPIPEVIQLVKEITSKPSFTQIIELIMPILPEGFELLINETISSARDDLISYLSSVQKAKKGGFAKIKLFMINKYVFGDSAHETFNKNELSRLRAIYGDVDSLPVDERLQVFCRKGQWHKVVPLLGGIDDIYPYLLIALKNFHANFVLNFLSVLKKRDAVFFTIIPQEAKAQEKLLKAAIELCEQNPAQGKAILTKMLNYKPWNKKVLASLANEVNDSDVRNLFVAVKPATTTTGFSLASNDEIVEAVETRLSVQGSSVSSPSVLFPSPSLISKDPLDKINIFLEVKCENEEANAQCYALVMTLIQFFQAYHLTRKDNLIGGLSCDQARRMRNAFVHQQVFDPKNRSACFLLDGEADNLIRFVKALLYSIRFRDSSKFLTTALFEKVVLHGDALAQQLQGGEREQVKFYQRVLYTQWLSKASASLESIRIKGSISLDMLEHAKAALSILKQLYCLKEAGCPQAALERAQAKAIRHSNAQLKDLSSALVVPSKMVNFV